MIASTFYDPVLGVDIHIIMVPTPAGPVPTPLPLPFVGIVLDPIGLAMNAAMGGSLVLINGIPATNCGTNVMAAIPHLPVPGPPQTGKFGDDAELFFGALNVEIGGSLAVRLAEIAMSCGDPVRMPTSRVIAVPKGSLVIVPRVPVPDLKLIATLIAFKIAGKLLKALAKLVGKGIRALQRGVLKNFFKGISERMRFAGEGGGRFKQLWNDTVCFLTGHPVDVATGRVITHQTDLELFGALPLGFSRRYDSAASARPSSMGFGWAHPYQQAIWPERGLLVLRAEDGREIIFSTLHFPDRVLSTGREVYLARERLTLRALGTLHFTVTNAAGVVREFARVAGGPEREARLVRVRDRLGNEQRFAYDRDGRLETVTDPAGRSLRFEYDRSGRLVQSDVIGTDGSLQRVCAYRYDTAGDLVEATDAHGHGYRYEYVEHLLVKETNKNGRSFYFQYDGVDEDAKCIRTWGDGGIYDHAITYDTAARRTLVENSLGQITLYQLDEVGQVSSITDALGRVESYEYDDLSAQKTKEAGPTGAETSSEYDARGNLVKAVAADGAEIELEYNEKNQLILARDALGGEWRWAYGARSELIGRINPLGESTQFHWANATPATPNGGAHLVAVTDPLGQHTELGYDGAGNLVFLKNPDATITQWGYDGFGRTRTTTNPNGATQRRERDALGRVVQVVEPDGNQRSLAYDAEGNLVRAQDQHYDVGFEYSGLNRLAARSQAGTRVEFLYDTEDRLVAIRNEHGLAYRFVLGPTGDVDEEWGFDDLRRRYVRDPAGRITLVARPQGKTTTYGYDAAGRVLSVAHSDGTSEAYTYRVDGAMQSAKNGAAALTFERDPLGRISRELHGEDWVSSAFDARGLRRSLQSSKGLTQNIRRNSMGDVLAIEAHIEGAAPVAPVAPSQPPNLSAAEEPNGAGASAPTSFSASFERDRLGLELERSLPGGVRAHWQRDTLGRPIRHEIWRGDQFHTAQQYLWDVNDRLTKIIDAMTGPVTYAHDAFGNLASAAYADGRIDLRLPDAVGNLFRTSDGSDRSYGRAGELLESRDARGPSTYAYDPEGNLIRKTEPDGGEWLYAWNGAGMLTRVIRPDGNIVEFTYDPLARRISKTYRGKITKWIWDGNVPLHEWVELDPTFDATALNATNKPQQTESALEIQAKARLAFLSAQPAQAPPPAAHDTPFKEGTKAAPITWLFEPESFAPLAKLIAGQRYGIVTDHLGTPQAMFDDVGREVWGAEIDAYGDLRNPRGERAACPFRWPGQYEDAETGLYYNRWRYYVPKDGIYLGQDPIGLLGSLAPYQYPADPLRQADPFGLTAAELAKAMADAGRPLSPGQTAHHIVKENAGGFAERSREILSRNGIPVDSAPNGAGLWGTHPSQVAEAGHPGRSAAATLGNYHGGVHIHGAENDKLIYKILKNAEERGADLNEVLRDIGERMEDGRWKGTAHGGCHG